MWYQRNGMEDIILCKKLKPTYILKYSTKSLDPWNRSLSNRNIDLKVFPTSTHGRRGCYAFLSVRIINP